MATQYSAIVSHLRRSFQSGRMKPLENRMRVLKQLRTMIEEEHQALCDAVKADLNRNYYETYSYELNLVLNEIDTALYELPEWSKPQKVRRTLTQSMDTAVIQRDPLGVVLVLGPWNYPLLLTIQVVVGACAAGNCVILKPSEVSPNTSKVLTAAFAKYIDQDVVRVIEGGVPETTELLKERFDHIFYTGSTQVGKVIMAAASKHLTPVTLELGGKSPTIIDSNMDVALAAKRIAWGKFLNCGQTCLAPDYVLCMESQKAQFIKEMAACSKEFFGEDPKQSPDYCRIIHERHVDRLETAMRGGGNIVVGGEVDRANRYIAPTIMTVEPEDPIMQQEIFGPILPVIGIQSIEEAIEFVNEREKPLALYIFSKSQSVVDQVLEQTTSGGVTVNDCILHVSLDTLPFGGVGNSGMGRYHGKYSFDTFTHEKSVLGRGTFGESLLWMRYPPLSDEKFKWAQFIVKKRRLPDTTLFKYVMALVFGLVLGYFIRMMSG